MIKNFPKVFLLCKASFLKNGLELCEIDLVEYNLLRTEQVRIAIHFNQASFLSDGAKYET